MRDSQKARCYRWERKHVAPHDATTVTFENIPPIVHYVWEQEGLKNPPIVRPIPKNVRRYSAKGCRVALRFPSSTHTWIILHELAHAMTSLPDGRTNGHGALFMGVYLKLLNRYMQLEMPYLTLTASRNNLVVDLSATPVCLEIP